MLPEHQFIRFTNHLKGTADSNGYRALTRDFADLTSAPVRFASETVLLPQAVFLNEAKTEAEF